MPVKFLLACDTYPNNPWERDRLPAIRKAINGWDHDIIDIYEFDTKEEAYIIHEQKGNNYFSDYNIKEINDKFYKKVQSYNCNILIMATVDNYAKYLLPSTVAKLQKDGIFVVGILGDDEFTFERNRFYVPMFDETIAYVKKCVEKYNQIKPQSCKYLPNSCYFEEKDFLKLQKDEDTLQYDVVFFGAPFGIRPIIMKSLVDAGIKIAIFGSNKWNNYAELKNFYYGYIESESIDKTIQKSKIVLALLEDHLTGKNHMNTKIWEAIRNGRMPITTRYSPLIEDYNLIENKEIVMYDSISDLINKVKYYLNNPKERIQITKNLFDKVKSNFDYEDLYYNLFQCLEKDYWNRSKKGIRQASYKKPLITIIDHSQHGEEFNGFCYLRSSRTQNWKKTLKENYCTHVKTPYVIFTNGNYNYSPYINELIRSFPEELTSGKKRVRALRNKKNTVQNIVTKINSIIWSKEEFYAEYLNKSFTYSPIKTIDYCYGYMPLCDEKEPMKIPKKINKNKVIINYMLYNIVSRIGNILHHNNINLHDINQNDFNAAKSHRSFDSMSGILSWLISMAKAEFNDFSLSKKAALEIGAGKFFCHAFGLYICGCDHVVSIDKYKQLLPDAMRAAMSTSTLSRRFLSPHISQDQYFTRMRAISSTGYDLNKLESLGIKYLAPYDLAQSKEFRESFDIVFSYTVLEHVPQKEIQPLIEKSISALRPGGFCIHFIDLEDHQDPKNNPFQFLSSGLKWNEQNCFTRGNRLRYSSWKQIFDTIKNIDWRYPYIATRHDAKLPDEVDNIFSPQEEDLRISAFVVVGKKVE